jgi:hypothetical protein
MNDRTCRPIHGSLGSGAFPQMGQEKPGDGGVDERGGTACYIEMHRQAPLG